MLELPDDQGRVTLWTVPELTPADVDYVIQQHREEVIDCPDCDGGWFVLLPVEWDTRRSIRVKCATCEGAGQLSRWDLQVSREADRFEDRS